MKKLILILLASFTFSACSEVQKIENGQIPDQYVDDVQPFLGSWAGSFIRHEGQLELSLNDSNQLIVEFIDGHSDDMIPGCNSSFGKLKEVEFKEDDGEVRITRATFFFDSNRCSRNIMGKEIHFFFNKAQNSAELRLLSRRWQDYECRIIGADPNGAPIRQCEYVTRDEYLYGHFSQSRN